MMTKKNKYQKHTNWIYAMYKGDNFLCEGTKDEICEQMGIKIATFHTYRTNKYRITRNTKKNNRRIVIRLDGEDKIYG